MGKFKDIWDRSKDGSRKEQRSFVRFFIISTAIFAVFMFVKKDSVIRWIQAGFTIRKQEKQIEYYHKDIERLDLQIRTMTSNRDSLERFARERFNFCEPGEDVYIVEE